jgi:hypothetical protein
MNLEQLLYGIGGLAVLAALVLAVIAWMVWLARWRWRQKGVGFAEGWFMVVDEREGRTLKGELYPGQRRQTAPDAQSTPAPTPRASTSKDTAGDPAPKYTITGRQIR